MKQLLAFIGFILILSGCDTLQNATNSTGSVFSLNGQWKLTSNLPDNSLVGSVVTVAPFVSEGRITLLANNTQCFRDDDVKWKDIVADKGGGFTLNNLHASCAGGTLVYQPATITVVGPNEIRLVGKNVQGAESTQVWTRIVVK